MTRLALVLVVAAAGVTTVVHRQHHHHTPTSAQSDVLTSVVPLRASRAQERQPLPARQTPLSLRTEQGVTPHSSRRAPVRRGPSRPAPGSGLSDVTMYCSTGSRNADGRWPELGDVAILDRSIPFGTHVVIEGRPYVVRDWIGYGSDFDIYGGSDPGCEQRALDFGRRHEHVEVGS